MGITILARLVAKDEDPLGYVTYVFECLDKEVILETKYVMCTRFPNWDHRKVEIDDEGYLNFKEIRAGVDTWYDGSTMIPYNYNNVQFIRFVPKKDKPEHEFKMLITLNLIDMRNSK